MTDIVLRDIDPALAERIRRVADRLGWTLPRTLLHLMEHGLRAEEIDGKKRFDAAETDVLQAAIAALEDVPKGKAFALIGQLPEINDRDD